MHRSSYRFSQQNVSRITTLHGRIRRTARRVKQGERSWNYPPPVEGVPGTASNARKGSEPARANHQPRIRESPMNESYVHTMFWLRLRRLSRTNVILYAVSRRV